MSNVNTLLVEVGSSVDNVTQSADRIRTELTTVRDDLNTAVTNCMAGGLGANCDPIVAVRDAISTSLGLIPNVSVLCTVAVWQIQGGFHAWECSQKWAWPQNFAARVTDPFDSTLQRYI